MPGTRALAAASTRRSRSEQPAEAHEGVGRRSAPVVHPARAAARPSTTPRATRPSPHATSRRWRIAGSARPRVAPASVPASTNAANGKTREARARALVEPGGEGLGQARGEARRPDERRRRDHGDGERAGPPGPVPPRDPLQAEHEELGRGDHLQRVAGEEQRALGRARRPDRLPEREVGKVQEVADAEDEQEPPGPAQARAQRQRRAREPRHEARGEEEARRRRAVEHLLEDVPGLGLHRLREQGVREVALHHREGHQAPERVDVELSLSRGALRRAPLRPPARSRE